jgi:ribosomal 50S subunit-recycling heat shock protein
VSVLLALKLTLAPGLVAATTLAGRRYGPRVGGWLGGLPVVVGPILLALAVERGDDFAAGASAGALIGLLALCAFALAYGRAAQATRWLPALVAGWLAAALATLALDPVSLPPLAALAAVFAGFALTDVMLPRTRALPPVRPPRWDLPLRAGATAALVMALTALAGVLGARLSGLLASLPVLASVLAAFTHAQEGAHASASLLRGMVRGLASYAVFCFALAELLPRTGTAVAFASATAAALATQGLSRPAWDHEAMDETAEPVRVDKWLWAARLLKTRSLAIEAVKGGRVQVNGQRVKPSKDIRAGDRVEITMSQGRRMTVDVLGTAERRGPAKVAVLLYEETAESREERERQAAEARLAWPPGTRGGARPTKRDRRRMDATPGVRRGRK